MDEKRKDIWLGYIVNYSLGPYWKNRLLFLKRLNAQNVVLCSDESLNNISTKKQLDMHIILFVENVNQIKRNYIGSEFIGHGDAETVVKAFSIKKLLLIFQKIFCQTFKLPKIK